MGGARAAASQEPPFDDGEPLPRPRLTAGRGGRPRVARTVKAEAAGPREALKPEQRLMLLDTWKRSGLAATEFMVAVTGLRRPARFQEYRAWESKVVVNTDSPKPECLCCKGIRGTGAGADVERYLR